MMFVGKVKAELEVGKSPIKIILPTICSVPEMTAKIPAKETAEDPSSSAETPPTDPKTSKSASSPGASDAPKHPSRVSTPASPRPTIGSNPIPAGLPIEMSRPFAVAPGRCNPIMAIFHRLPFRLRRRRGQVRAAAGGSHRRRLLPAMVMEIDTPHCSKKTLTEDTASSTAEEAIPNITIPSLVEMESSAYKTETEWLPPSTPEKLRSTDSIHCFESPSPSWRWVWNPTMNSAWTL
mmetsp:Transcript_4512/g.9358  ORF Transcript_4512/g.9358 Transcript_4512/m.9358 type:complete len:236 (+) Transcript_4512:106-813(+)